MKKLVNLNIDLEYLRDNKILCAFSGGADSVCLLHFLHSRGIKVTAAHYEHGIRGEESVRDMNFAEEFCKKRGIPFVCGRGDVPAFAKEAGLGLEEAARQLRYEFLREQADELNCKFIVTAHNADDNAETIILNLCRGAGTAGLSGIPYFRGRIIRPMLKVTRAQVESYLELFGLPHVEDSSNASDEYTRNMVRHQIIPRLKEINPRFVEASIRTAELCTRDDNCLNFYADSFDTMFRRGNTISVRRIKGLHPALASRLIRKKLPGLSMEHVDRVIELAEGDGYAELNIPGHTLRRDGGKIFIGLPDSVTLPDIVLSPGMEVVLPGARMKVSSEICTYEGEVNDLFTTSYLKCEMMEGVIHVTGRRDGDRIRPLGRGCTKTLKALFLEKQYTQNQRNSCPILRDERGPLLVYGLAIAERAKPEPGELAFKISFTKY